MKKVAVLLCFMGISFNILSIIRYELREYQGINYHIIINSVSLLLLLYIAYVIFLEYREVGKNTQSANQVPLDGMKALFRYMPSSVMILEKDFTIIDMNEFMSNNTGFHTHEIKGKKCYDMFGNGEVCCNCLVKKALISRKPEYNVLFKYNSGSKLIYGKQVVIPITDCFGNIECIYEMMIDMTQEILLEKENLQILMGIVTSMAHLIERRDPSTGTHSVNVQRIALSIGEFMELDAKELQELSIAAILHDIGKIGIPESILNKPGRLTDFEFSIIQRHPLIGYEVIKPIKRLKKVSEAIRDHHEYYNGRGYPSGKKKEELSMITRILTVADVFEALTANRVYRKAMSIKQAIGIIETGKEQQFDPRVVDALIELVGKEKEKQAI